MIHLPHTHAHVTGFPLNTNWLLCYIIIAAADCLNKAPTHRHCSSKYTGNPCAHPPCIYTACSLHQQGSMLTLFARREDVLFMLEVAFDKHGSCQLIIRKRQHWKHNKHAEIKVNLNAKAWYFKQQCTSNFVAVRRRATPVLTWGHPHAQSQIHKEMAFSV